MISLFKAHTRIPVQVGNEDVVFIMRTPSAPAISKFLGSRFEQKRNKVVNKLYEARAAFFDAHIVDVENASYETADGEMRPLNKETLLMPEDKAHASLVLGIAVESWKDLIPVNWKSSAAMFFEDSAQGGDGEGN